MIRPLRQRHRHIMIVLGIFLPVALAVGIAGRKAVPVSARLPEVLAASSGNFASVEWARNDLFAKAPVRLELLREQKTGGGFAIELSAAKDFVKPDLLVYWVAGNPPVSETLPADAVLLGSFSASPLPLSDEIVKSAGVLILYSLADNELVAASKPIRLKAITE